MARATSGRIVHACECDSSKTTRAIGMKSRVRGRSDALNAASRRIRATIRRIDDVDHKIVALLVQDGRRTYGDIGREVALSAPAVKRRVDRLRRDGALRGFTAGVDHAPPGHPPAGRGGPFSAPRPPPDEGGRGRSPPTPGAATRT